MITFDEKLACGGVKLRVNDTADLFSDPGVFQITLTFETQMQLLAATYFNKEKGVIQLTSLKENLPQIEKALRSVYRPKQNFLHRVADFLQEKNIL